LHGGTLMIRSSKGVGTAVTVTFPRERSEPAPPAENTGDNIRAVAGG
jgi:hypothetical protein